MTPQARRLLKVGWSITGAFALGLVLVYFVGRACTGRVESAIVAGEPLSSAETFWVMAMRFAGREGLTLAALMIVAMLAVTAVHAWRKVSEKAG